MAQVLLDRKEIEAGLPAICMRCGQPATGLHQRTMRWSWLTEWSSAYLFVFWVFVSFGAAWEPGKALLGKEGYFWLVLVAGLLPTVIADFLTQKRVQLNVPYCNAHVKFRAWGNFIFYAAWILAISVLVVLALIGWFPLLADDARRPLKFAMLALPFILIGVGYALRENAITRAEIRALLITDDSILLAGVSPGFVMALQSKRDNACESPSKETEG